MTPLNWFAQLERDLPNLPEGAVRDAWTALVAWANGQAPLPPVQLLLEVGIPWDHIVRFSLRDAETAAPSLTIAEEGWLRRQLEGVQS